MSPLRPCTVSTPPLLRGSFAREPEASATPAPSRGAFSCGPSPTDSLSPRLSISERRFFRASSEHRSRARLRHFAGSACCRCCASSTTPGNHHYRLRLAVESHCDTVRRGSPQPAAEFPADSALVVAGRSRGQSSHRRVTGHIQSLRALVDPEARSRTSRGKTIRVSDCAFR
jgi:hypothetical protein